jgi:hypothetical protein
MLNAAKRHGHQFHGRVLERGNDLFSSLGRNVIDKSGSSEPFGRILFPQNETFLYQSLEMLFEGVVAEAYLALECSEALGFAVFKRGQYALVKEVHFRL